MTRLAESIAEIEGLELLPVRIGRRKAFPAAAALGLSVLEHPRQDPKAVEELNALVAAIFGGHDNGNA